MQAHFPNVEITLNILVFHITTLYESSLITMAFTIFLQYILSMSHKPNLTQRMQKQQQQISIPPDGRIN